MIQLTTSRNQFGFARHRTVAFAAILFFSAVLAGCPKGPITPKMTHAGIVIPPSPPAVAPQSDPPDVQLEATEYSIENPLPVVFDVPPEKPPAPHHTAPAAEPEPEKVPGTPQIAPQISPQDQQRAQGDTNTDLQTARQNLASVSGRRMNATQQDLADKIRGFMQQARDAMTAGDWKSARNLAEKARVLSIDLIHSF